MSSIGTPAPHGDPRGAVTGSSVVSTGRGTRARDVARALVSTHTGVVGAVLVGLMVIGALAAWFGLTPYDPIEQRPVDRLKAPSGSYSGFSKWGTRPAPVTRPAWRFRSSRSSPARTNAKIRVCRRTPSPTPVAASRRCDSASSASCSPGFKSR